MNRAITIGREFGSGGRELGQRLAERLGIPFYDKEMITAAASEGGLSPEIIRKHEESRSSNLSPKGWSHYGYYQQPITDQIYLAQSKVIKDLAAQGPCVIVGRCADHVLQDRSINLFVQADLEARMKRKGPMNTGLSEQELRKHVLDTDKARKRYYEHYTDYKWGSLSQFHLCIDTTHVGIDACVETILHYVKNFVPG